MVGEEEEESKPKTDELSLPVKPRGLDECVVILNNPEVRCYTNQSSSVKVTYVTLAYFSYLLDFSCAASPIRFEGLV